MNNSSTNTPMSLEPPVLNDCWNKIGVRGDASCPKLETHIHCRNCPVFSAAAVEILNRDLPENYLEEWTGLIAQERPTVERDTQSVVLFRIGSEWFALPTAVFKEIVGIRPVHSLPHRRNGIVLGVANVRGELLVCISLRKILQLEETPASKNEKHHALNARMLFLQHEGLRAVCPVDEVFGIQRFRPQELVPIPATLAKAAPTYTKSVFAWQEKTVGLLDELLLFYSMNRGLA